MPSYEMTNPPSVSEYKKGLLLLFSNAKSKASYLPLLLAHYRAPGRTVTLGELNKIAGCKTVTGVNMLHVHIAKGMFSNSGIRPDVPAWDRNDARWWPFLYIYHETGLETSNAYELRPELAQALAELDEVLTQEST